MTRNFLLATALSLAIALGGLITLSSGSAQASAFEGTAVSAAPITDADACSTAGWYNAGSYNPGGVYYVNTWDMPVVQTSYLGMPWGWGGYGFPFYPGITTTAVTVPPSPYLPNETQPYTAGNINNYACNAFSNCLPVANANAVVCPGNPSGIALNSSLTASTCGSATNIDAKVVGPNGLSVADGTPVLFSSTLGLVPAESSTNDGIASVSLVFPPKTTGVATLTVTSGMARTETKITVTC